MEGQYMPGGEPPKVRTRKPKVRDPAVDINQGSREVVHGQEPSIRKSNRAAQQQPPPPPEVATWDGYGNADPTQAYPEHYGHGDEQHVDAHGYGYTGPEADAHQGYGYGDASHGYGYADAGQLHGYGDANQGYGYADAGQGYGNAGQGHADAGLGYGYGGAEGDGAQGYGYVAPTQHTAKEKPKKTRRPKPVADCVYSGGYQGEHQGSYENQHLGEGYAQPVRGGYEGSYGSQHQVDAYGQPLQDGYAYPEAYNAAPDPNAHKREPSKSHKPSRVKSLERRNHGDVDPGNGAYAAQYGEPSYGINYEDGMVPAAGANPKGRKKNKESQYEDFPVLPEGTPYAESALPSRAISRVRGEHDGSTGSRTSQEGSHGPASGRSKSSDREGSGSHRAKPHRDGSGSGSGRVRAENETRSSREGLTPSGTPRLNPVARDGSDRSNPEQRSSRSKEKAESEGKSVKTREVRPPPLVQANPDPNPLNEHMRKTASHSKPKPTYDDMSMTVFHDPNDRTLIDVKNSKPDRPKESPKAAPAPARSALNEWMKKQSELSEGNNFNQHDSLIVMPDDNKEMLETQIFGVPLAKQQSITLPPVAKSVDRPQYQPRGGNLQYQPVVENPLHQPVQRRPYADTPLPPSYEPYPPGGALEVYDADGKQIQPAMPNAKCMACVQNIGVPVARIATRIACRQCMATGTCGCTIL